jgi:hypothetical protein
MREGGFKIQARRADALSADPRDKPEDDERERRLSVKPMKLKHFHSINVILGLVPRI